MSKQITKTMNRAFSTITFALFILTGTFGQNVSQKISEQKLKAHISYLASDKLKGRGTASPEEKIAAQYLVNEFKKAGLKPINKSYLKPFEFRHNTNPHDTSLAGLPVKKSNNVVAWLNNNAPHTIIIGAHYDHLGLGHDRNSLDANPEGKIHNGADDNASGTAGVLELARYFANNKIKEPYNFLFICFSGEELGLLGSKKYVENPDINLNTVNYMINLDMIGRLNDSTKKLMVYGVGTSPVWVPMLSDIKNTSLKLVTDSSGIGPSDQTSFYLKDVPVLHFFSGQHSDYHKPSDDEEKINYKGQTEILEFIITVIEKTLTMPKLEFQKTRNPDMGKSSFKVSMGVMPDYSYDGKGMRIDGVSEGKPAQKAGLQAGDVIIKLTGKEVRDVKEYMKILSEINKGDLCEVEILREGKNKVLKVQF